MIRNIAVIGGGTMGHAIALTFAAAGFPVALCEPEAAVRESVMGRVAASLAQLGRDEGALGRISLHGELAGAAAGADYVIEAVPERLELKRELLVQLDALCPAGTILASNTSSLRLADMMAPLPPARRARCMICHWYNPAHIVPIAELSRFGNMAEADFEAVRALYIAAGKQPVTVEKDLPGLVANRLLHAMAREAMHLAEAGAASFEDIDRALRWGPGFRAAAAGIFEQADMGGIDVWCAAEDNFLPHLSNETAASPLLRERAGAGSLGVKTGGGFYDYPDPAAAGADFNRRLLGQLGISRG